MTDKERSRLLWRAWYDYCFTNRLIAYGENPSMTEEQIEAYCKAQLRKDWKEIRRKYESTNSKSRVISERRST